MKGMEGRKEGRERLLLAAQDPGPEQAPRISGRDRTASLRSFRASLSPAGTAAPFPLLPGSLRPFFFSQPSVLASGARLPSILSFTGDRGKPSFSFSGVTCVSPPFLPLGKNVHPPPPPPSRAARIPPFLKEGTRIPLLPLPPPPPASLPPPSDLLRSIPPSPASLFHPWRCGEARSPLCAETPRSAGGPHGGSGALTAVRLGSAGLGRVRPGSARLGRVRLGSARTCCPQPLPAASAPGGAARGTFHSCFHTPALAAAAHWSEPA